MTTKAITGYYKADPASLAGPGPAHQFIAAVAGVGAAAESARRPWLE